MAVSNKLTLTTLSLIALLGLNSGHTSAEYSNSAAEFIANLDMEDVTVTPDSYLSNILDGKPNYERLYDAMAGFQDCYVSKADPRWIEGIKKYDCRENLKVDGQWKKADQKMVAFLKQAAPGIRDIADEYGVDARAMVAAALTEASLNSKSKGNRMVGFLKSLGVGDDTVLDLGKMISQNISLGLGAMNERGACEALPVRQAIEKGFAVGLKCPARDKLPDALRSDLGKTAQSVRYAAGLVRLAQDAYFARGCDVSDNMGALVTLYNMGRVKERAQRSQCHRGGSVGWNYLGLWAEKNSDTIESIVNSKLQGGHYQAKIVRTPAL